MVLIYGSVLGLLCFLFDFFFIIKEKNAKNAVKSFFKNMSFSWFFNVLVVGIFMRMQIITVDQEDAPTNWLYFAIAFALTALVKALLTLLMTHCIKIERITEKSSKGIKWLKGIGFTIAAVASVCFAAASWVYSNYGGITFDQIIVNVLSPTTGTEETLIISIIERGIIKALLSIIFAAWLIFPKVNVKFVRPKKNIASVITHFAKSVISLVLAVSFLIFSLWYGIDRLKLATFTEAFFRNSTYIEDNYIDPSAAKITFPETKRNLIFIYLESMENSYLSKDLGGYMDVNLMPELTELAKEGIVFSDRPEGQFGGPTLASCSQWSAAGIVNMNSGLPLKFPSDFRKDFGTNGYFMNGAYTLGDILHKEGYNQTVMFGASAFFAGLDVFFKQHGDFKIFDLRYARNTGLIPKDYKVWWGFEDDKLYEFAKDEITRLYEEGKPFNFMMETADTHFPDGYLTPGAPTPHKSQYANVISYSTKQTVEFVRWIQAQPFYENTTIVLIGDHPSMDKKFFRNFDSDYKRTTFNLILNPANDLNELDVSRRHNRLWASIDMFPTTLASMGCTIDGNRLGLGTNLFSDEKTLFERDGIEYVNDHLLSNSDFYTNVIMSE